jgi:hypothetical protein
VAGEPAVKVRVAALVIDGGSKTVSVNFCTAAGVMPLRAVMSKT